MRTEIISIPVRVPPRKMIGETVAALLNGLKTVEPNQTAHVVAIVPRILVANQIHGYNLGEAFEVTEADVLIEWRPL